MNIDVLLPVRNGGVYLDAALSSIREQSVRDWRLLLIDDGSTDESLAVAGAYAAEDPRIVIVPSRGKGIVAALNTGLALCTGDFVARMDADDISAPNRFELQLQRFASNPRLVALSGAHQTIDACGKEEGSYNPGDPRRADPLAIPAREPHLPHPFMMMRRDTLVAIGGYRPFRHSEDADLWWRLSEIGDLANLSQPLGCYRIHAGSVSTCSIVNARLQVVTAHLAALAHRRRRAGQGDILLTEHSVSRIEAAVTLDGMLAVARKLLTVQEIDYLRRAASVKLALMSFIRRFELEASDVEAIAAVAAELRHFPSPDRRSAFEYLSQLAMRLAQQGEARLAGKLDAGLKAAAPHVTAPFPPPRTS